MLKCIYRPECFCLKFVTSTLKANIKKIIGQTILDTKSKLIKEEKKHASGKIQDH